MIIVRPENVSQLAFCPALAAIAGPQKGANGHPTIPVENPGKYGLNTLSKLATGSQHPR